MRKDKPKILGVIFSLVLSSVLHPSSSFANVSLRGGDERPILYFSYAFSTHEVEKELNIFLTCSSEGVLFFGIEFSPPTRTEFRDQNFEYTNDFSGFVRGDLTFEAFLARDGVRIRESDNLIVATPGDHLLFTSIDGDDYRDKSSRLLEIMTSPLFEIEFEFWAHGRNYRRMKIVDTQFLRFQADEAEIIDQLHFRYLCNEFGIN